MKRFPLVIALAALVSVACQDRQSPTAPDGPSLAIRDGHSDPARSSFFFLWPIRRFDQEPPTEGFNADLRPVVEICRLNLDRTCVSGPPVARLTMSTGSATLNRVFVFPDHQEYAVLWVARNLVAGQNHRIRVLVGGKELGFADLDVVGTIGELLRYPDRDNFAPLLKDFILPIRFWIGEGAFGVTHPDHVEKTVTNDGGTVTTNTKFAGAQFPAGWLPAAAVAAGITEVVLIIERVDVADESSCLQSELLEKEGCYRFETQPDLKRFGAFSENVTLGMCFEDPLNPEDPLGGDPLNTFQIHRRAERERQPDPEAEVQALTSKFVGFIECHDFTPTIGASGSGGVQNLARAGWRALRQLGRWLGPQPLHARTAVIDFGVGTELRSDHPEEAGFSRYTFARAATMTIAAGDDQAGTVGTALETDPEVCLQTLHPTTEPIVGALVTFEVTTDIEGAESQGSVSTSPVPTNEAGCASTTWTLADAPGDNTLSASADGVMPRQVIFTATGEALTPTATSLASGVPLAGVGFTVPLEATVTPAPPLGSIVEFFEGATSLGTALTNEAGRATRSVTLNGVLARQFFTARFTGTTSHGASTSPVAVQQKWQHFDDPASFTAALGGAVTETQDFEGLDLGTTVSAVIGSVLNVTSSFPTLSVFECTTKCLFGAGGDVRVSGNGQYDLVFLAPRNAIAFDLASQHPATGPASIQIFAALTGVTIGERNLGADESTPNFFGIILTVPIQRVLVLEGPEVGGSGNEEIGLDNFIIASVPFSP